MCGVRDVHDAQAGRRIRVEECRPLDANHVRYANVAQSGAGERGLRREGGQRGSRRGRRRETHAREGCARLSTHVARIAPNPPDPCSNEQGEQFEVGAAARHRLLRTPDLRAMCRAPALDNCSRLNAAAAPASTGKDASSASIGDIEANVLIHGSALWPSIEDAKPARGRASFASHRVDHPRSEVPRPGGRRRPWRSHRRGRSDGRAPCKASQHPDLKREQSCQNRSRPSRST